MFNKRFQPVFFSHYKRKVPGHLNDQLWTNKTFVSMSIFYYYTRDYMARMKVSSILIYTRIHLSFASLIGWRMTALMLSLKRLKNTNHLF